MKIRIQIASALLLASVLSAAASGQWQQSLNGQWQFTKNAAAATWDTDTLPAYATHKDKGWGADEVPSFTLRGYKLKWDGGEISLPNLKPGDAAWTSDAKVKPGTIVKLFAPTGYDVADSE